jgi:hypothetical protein
LIRIIHTLYEYAEILQFSDTGLTALPFLGNSKPRRRYEKRAKEISPALVRMCAKGCSIGLL